MRTLIFLFACQLVCISSSDASQEKKKLQEIITDLRKLSLNFRKKAAPTVRNMTFPPTCNCNLQAMKRLIEILPGIDADVQDEKHVKMILKNLKALHLPEEVKHCTPMRKRRSKSTPKDPDAPYFANLQSFYRNASCSF